MNKTTFTLSMQISQVQKRHRFIPCRTIYCKYNRICGSRIKRPVLYLLSMSIGRLLGLLQPSCLREVTLSSPSGACHSASSIIHHRFTLLCYMILNRGKRKAVMFMRLPTTLFITIENLILSGN